MKTSSGRSLLKNRIAMYSIILFATYLGLFSYLVITNELSAEKEQSPYGVDFADYYAAGRMVLEGNIDDIYDEAIHHARLEQIIGTETPFYLSWIYPPTFLLVIVPLSLLPYYAALFLWNLGTLAFAVFAAWLLLNKSFQAALPVVGYTGVWANFRWSQNTCLSLGLIGLGLHYIESRPMLSGLMFGLLTYKPQLAVFPIAFLIFTGKWKPLKWTAVFAAALAFVSIIIFGISPWVDLISCFYSRTSVFFGGETWESTNAVSPTILTALKLLGTSDILAWSVQIAVMPVTAFAVRWIWKKSESEKIKYASAIIGMTLILPYAIQYELMLLGLAFALIIDEYRQNGSSVLEKITLFLIWLLPVGGWILAANTGVQIAPVILILELAALVARVKNPRLRLSTT